MTTEEGFCVSALALMASEGFLPVSPVTSLIRAATTEGNRFTHSVDRSSEGRHISWAYRSAGLKDRVHLWAQANILCDCSPGALVF